MTILHLITRLILGGAQENTVLSCEGLSARGRGVILAHGPIYGPEGSLADRVHRGDYRVIELPHMVRPPHPWKDGRAYRECRALIRHLRPDVVHTHSSKAGILGRAAAWREGVPVVVHTVRGLPFHAYQSRLVHRLYVAAERWAARRCHTIVCVADAMSRQSLAAGVGRPEQYTTVYSGMETGPFLEGHDDRTATRAALGLGPQDIVVGTVARLSPLKGHDDLLDALPTVLSDQPSVKLLWVGDGWWRRRLERRIERQGLQGRVVITGLVPQHRVPSMVRAMDVLVHPSYREGLARTLPQALLSGVPVVSYDVDGASEVCLDGVTGYLVRPAAPSALATAVSRLAASPETRGAFGREGRRLCAARFDTATMVDTLDRLYHRLRPSGHP